MSFNVERGKEGHILHVEDPITHIDQVEVQSRRLREGWRTVVREGDFSQHLEDKGVVCPPLTDGIDYVKSL